MVTPSHVHLLQPVSGCSSEIKYAAFCTFSYEAYEESLLNHLLGVPVVVTELKLVVKNGINIKKLEHIQQDYRNELPSSFSFVKVNFNV